MSGEFETIARITPRFVQHDDVLLGPGDDAALLATNDGRVLASTDILIEGVHFRTDWATAHDIGRRAAAQNFADIVAMGGTPTALLVGLAAPADTDPRWFDEFAAGLAVECAQVGASVVGGDMSRSDRIMVAVTVLGDLDGRTPVLRSGARTGDVVAVAGRLGWSAAGLCALQTGTDVAPGIIDAYLTPAPPYTAGPLAADSGAHAMIDVSDGLLADLGHIADASAVSIDIDSSTLVAAPELIHAAELLEASARQWMLTGGEDHALAATFASVDAVPRPFHVIGRVIPRGVHAVTVDGAPHPGQQGHDHFA